MLPTFQHMRRKLVQDFGEDGILLPLWRTGMEAYWFEQMNCLPMNS
jgi:hypothetical protein